MLHKRLLVLEIIGDIGDFVFQLAQLITKLTTIWFLFIEVANVLGRKSRFFHGRLQSESDAVFGVKFIIG